MLALADDEALKMSFENIASWIKVKNEYLELADITLKPLSLLFHVVNLQGKWKIEFFL